MSDKEEKQFNLLKIENGERYLGKAEDIANYLRYCLNETITQYLADGYSWEETAPVLCDIWEYIEMVEAQDHAEIYAISENPMCASGILVKPFEEKA